MKLIVQTCFSSTCKKNNVWKLKKKKHKNSRNWNNSLPDFKNNRHRADKGVVVVMGASVLRQI